MRTTDTMCISYVCVRRYAQQCGAQVKDSSSFNCRPVRRPCWFINKVFPPKRDTPIVERLAWLGLRDQNSFEFVPGARC